MTAFIIWTVMGAMFIIMGIVDIFSKKQKAFGFWANAQTLKMEDVKAYNRALGILWIVYGIILILLGLPLLLGDNSPGVIITILGTMFEAIAAMAVYVTVIEKRYRKR